MADSSTYTIPELEKASGLSANIRQIIKADSWPDMSIYAARLAILAYGYDSHSKKYTVTTELATGTNQTTTVTVDSDFYNKFILFLEQNGLKDLVSKTPAGSEKTQYGGSQLDSVGALGSQLRYTSNNALNAMTGPAVNHPSIVGDMLNSIHPGMVDELENFCNVIRTRSYLSLPSDSFGSINQAMWYITGAVTAFYGAIIDIYQGMIQLMQQFFATINSIIGMIQQEIISIIERIIPLDLICMILDAVQTILDDIGFFAQLFGGSDQLFTTLNSIQTVVNFASFGVNFAYNPIGGLTTLFPQQAQQVFDFVNSIQTMPQTFVSKMMTNFGFGTIANNEGLAIANTIIQYYGLGAQLGPLGPVIASAGIAPNKSNWYRTNNTGTNLPTQVNPFFFASSYQNGGVVDINGINQETYTTSVPENFNNQVD